MVCTQVNLAGLVREMYSQFRYACLNVSVEELHHNVLPIERCLSILQSSKVDAVHSAREVLTFGTISYLSVHFFQGLTQPRRSFTRKCEANTVKPA